MNVELRMLQDLKINSELVFDALKSYKSSLSKNLRKSVELKMRLKEMICDSSGLLSCFLKKIFFCIKRFEDLNYHSMLTNLL